MDDAQEPTTVPAVPPGTEEIDAADPVVAATTTNGTVRFFTYTTVPSAGTQLLQDASTFIASACADPTGEPSLVGDPVGDIISAVGVGAQLVSTAVAVGQFGLGIANTVRDFQNPTSQSDTTDPTRTQQGVASIVVANNALVPVAFVSVKSASCAMSHAPTAVTTGQSGTFLVTRDQPLDGTTALTLACLIGTGSAASISISLAFNYSVTHQVWTLTMTVDGTAYQFPYVAGLAGCNFEPSSSAYPNFSVYFAPIETASGTMQITFYPNSDVT